MKPWPSSVPSRFDGRHPHAVEEQLGGVLPVLADLVQHAAAREPLAALGLDDDQRDAGRGVVRIGLGHDDHELGEQAVGDERLGAVDDVLVAVADRLGLDVLQIRAGAGLGHRDGADQLAGWPASGSQRCFCSSVP